MTKIIEQQILSHIENENISSIGNFYSDSHLYVFGSLSKSTYLFHHLKLGTSTFVYHFENDKKGDLFWCSLTLKKLCDGSYQLSVNEDIGRDTKRLSKIKLIEKKIKYDIQQNKSDIYFIIKNPVDILLSTIMTIFTSSYLRKDYVNLYNTIKNESILDDIGSDEFDINDYNTNKIKDFFETVINSNLNEIVLNYHLRNDRFISYFLLGNFLQKKLDINKIKLLNIDHLGDILENEFELEKNVRKNQTQRTDIKKYVDILNQIKINLIDGSRLNLERLISSYIDLHISQEFMSLELLEREYEYYKSTDNNDKKDS